jgi:hypothetical protein
MARVSGCLRWIADSPDLRILGLMLGGIVVFGVVDGSLWRSLLSPTLAYRPAVLFGLTLLFGWRGFAWSQLLFLISFTSFLGWRGAVFITPLYLVSQACALVAARRLAGNEPLLSRERSTLAFLAAAVLAPAVPALLNSVVLRVVGGAPRPEFPAVVDSWLRGGAGILALVPAMLVCGSGRLQDWVALPREREWRMPINARSFLELSVEVMLWTASLG